MQHFCGIFEDWKIKFKFNTIKVLRINLKSLWNMKWSTHFLLHLCCRTEIWLFTWVWTILCKIKNGSILLSFVWLLQNAFILITEKGLKCFIMTSSLIFVLFKNPKLYFMHCRNHTLFTACQQHFSIMLELKLELNFKNDAAYCMCSDNQEDSSVYHYFGITNGKEVIEMISNIPRITSLFFC